MWKTRNDADPVVAFSLNAEKAFDKVELHFLFLTLEAFRLGPLFGPWIEILHTEPQASVFTNGLMSSPFKLSCGTHQVLPLSPLIFALFLEPLAPLCANINILYLELRLVR